MRMSFLLIPLITFEEAKEMGKALVDSILEELTLLSASVSHLVSLLSLLLLKLRQPGIFLIFLTS